MKVQMQISIEHTLKERLRNISDQTGVPASKIVSDLLETHLDKIEQDYRIQPKLQVPMEAQWVKK